MVLDFWSLVLGSWFLVLAVGFGLGCWFRVFGVGFVVRGSWVLVVGAGYGFGSWFCRVLYAVRFFLVMTK